MTNTRSNSRNPQPGNPHKQHLCSQLWKEVAQTEMKRVDRPRPPRNRPTTNQSKFCVFHDGFGHTTDQCYELCDAIERFIRDDKLRQYLIKTQGHKNGKRKQGGRSRSPTIDSRNEKRRKPSSEDDEFQCNAISGGFGGGVDTISQCKKYLREVFTVRDLPKFKDDPTKLTPPPLNFTKEELKDVVLGHQEGLVITGTLVHCRVKRIFVDVGSSMDIFSWDAFKRMNMDVEDLKPCRTTHIGFNGEHSFPKGYVDLRLTLGTKDSFKSERVRFIVADFPSRYNIILGRPTIHNWDMLVSTKHQKLKIVNNKNQVVVVNEDQKESQQCYFETVRGGEGGPSSPPRICDVLTA